MFEEGEEMSGAKAVCRVIQAVVRPINSQPACNIRDEQQMRSDIARFPPISEQETSP